jgi:hypothetical protein
MVKVFLLDETDPSVLDMADQHRLLTAKNKKNKKHHA